MIIPDKNGRYADYRILYNADFMEILPTDSKEINNKKIFDELS